MDKRIDPHRPESRIIKDAVQQSNKPGGSDRLSRGGVADFFMPESQRSLPITDGGGVVHTGKVFVLGLDQLDDDYAYLGVIP